MEGIEVKIEQILGELALQRQIVVQALEANTNALQSLERKIDGTVKWLVVAVIGSAMGTEALRIVAAAVLKGI